MGVQTLQALKRPIFSMALSILTLVGTVQAAPRSAPTDPFVRLRQSSLEVFGQLSPGSPTCFSPLGLWRNFALAELAARGDTQGDFQRVSGLKSEDLRPLIEVDPLSYFGRWRSAWFVSLSPDSKQYQALRSLSKLDSTIEKLSLHQPALAARAINDWGRWSRAHSPLLVTPADLQGSQSVLVSQIQIQASPWPSFDPRRTSQGPFQTTAGTTMLATMRGSLTVGLPSDWSHWDRQNQALAVDLPLQHQKRLTIIIPPLNSDLARFEATLSESRLTSLLEELQPTAVHLSVPKIWQSQRINLTRPLSQLGLTRPFSSADFTGLLDQNGDPVAWRLATVVQEVQFSLQEAPSDASAVQAALESQSRTPSPLKPNLNRPSSLAQAPNPRPKQPAQPVIKVKAQALGSVQAKATGLPQLRIDRPFLYLVRDPEAHRFYVLGRFTGTR